MKIKVINFRGKEYEGEWNGKFYSSFVEGRTDLFRIYINNDEYIHVTEEVKEQLIKDVSKSKIDEDNLRIGIILREFKNLSTQAKEVILQKLNFDFDDEQKLRKLGIIK